MSFYLGTNQHKINFVFKLAARNHKRIGWKSIHCWM